MREHARIDFLAHLLARESGLRPECFDWYKCNIDKMAFHYPVVVTPGLPVRHPNNGALILEQMTVRQYFATLGVDHLFVADDPQCLRSMQYAAINALGFVGYQFGERILIEHGYYRAACRRVDVGGEERWVECYYSGAVTAWRPGAKQVLHQDGAGRIFVPTSTNEWRGDFLGKNDIWSLDDLRRADAQERVIRDVLTDIDQHLADALAARGIADPHGLPIVRSILIAPELPHVSLRCTRAGLLACAHLCGVQPVLDLLDHGIVRVDEFGTSMIDYMLEFTNDIVDLRFR
jgi:hypothetical protein